MSTRGLAMYLLRMSITPGGSISYPASMPSLSRTGGSQRFIFFIPLQWFLEQVLCHIKRHNNCHNLPIGELWLVEGWWWVYVETTLHQSVVFVVSLYVVLEVLMVFLGNSSTNVASQILNFFSK